MKKTIALFAFLLAIFILSPAILLTVGLVSPAVYDATFVGALSQKIDRLDKTESPKIIVIGGSSAAFGLRSDLLEKETGMPAVNFGLYASLGTKLMLDLAKHAVKEGDIVIIAPEQDAQTLSNYFNPDSTWRAFDGHPEYLAKLGKSELAEMAGAYLSFVSDKYGYMLKKSKPAVSGVYTASSFNEYGDISYERPSNNMVGGYDANTPISFEKEVISVDFIDYLNAFASFARSKKASVYYGFCPMNRAALEEGCTAENISVYFNYLLEKLDFPVIGNPEAHLMESGWFYDSNFHMNDAGAVAYTLLLAREIKLALGDTSPCVTETPEMPALPFEPGEEAVMAEDLLVLSESGGVITVTGLTDKGALADVIEIPSEIDGKPVAAIASGAFSAGKSLRQIIINEGMSFIAGGAFDGCESLEKIIVLCSAPEKVRVDDELLLGAEAAVVYVPAEYFDAYANDYYWTAIYDLGLLASE